MMLKPLPSASEKSAAARLDKMIFLFFFKIIKAGTLCRSKAYLTTDIGNERVPVSTQNNGNPA